MDKKAAGNYVTFEVYMLKELIAALEPVMIRGRNERH